MTEEPYIIARCANCQSEAPDGNCPICGQFAQQIESLRATVAAHGFRKRFAEPVPERGNRKQLKMTNSKLKMAKPVHRGCPPD